MRLNVMLEPYDDYELAYIQMRKEYDQLNKELEALRTENEALKLKIEKVIPTVQESVKRAGIEHLGVHAEIVSENEPCIDVSIVKAYKADKE